MQVRVVLNWGARDIRPLIGRKHARSHAHWTGLVGNAVIDTFVQRTPRGRYTCQINQLISRQDSKGRARQVTNVIAEKVIRIRTVYRN